MVVLKNLDGVLHRYVRCRKDSFISEVAIIEFGFNQCTPFSNHVGTTFAISF